MAFSAGNPTLDEVKLSHTVDGKVVEATLKYELVLPARKGGASRAFIRMYTPDVATYIKTFDTGFLIGQKDRDTAARLILGWFGYNQTTNDDEVVAGLSKIIELMVTM